MFETLLTDIAHIPTTITEFLDGLVQSYPLPDVELLSYADWNPVIDGQQKMLENFYHTHPLSRDDADHFRNDMEAVEKLQKMLNDPGMRDIEKGKALEMIKWHLNSWGQGTGIPPL